MIPHNQPYYSKNQEALCREVLSGTQLVNGKKTRELEDALCEHLGLAEGHVVLVSSGSAALYLSMWALELENKSVAMPVYACSALTRAAKMVGCTPKLIDIKSDSFELDQDAVDEGISGAIFPHMYGIPSEIKLPPSIKVIEDCAQSLGAKINAKSIGLQGDIGIYSFYATKMITTAGHGGACFSKSKELIDKIRDYIYFDCKDFSKPGFNFQMTEVQAACGLSQFGELDMILEKRDATFQYYQAAGLPLLGINLKNGFEAARYRAIITCDDPERLIQEMAESGIRVINPLETWELLSSDHLNFPNALTKTKKTVSLPIFPALSNAEVSYIASQTKEKLCMLSQ